MLSWLVQFGRDEHLERIVADVLTENVGMRHLCSDSASGS